MNIDKEPRGIPKEVIDQIDEMWNRSGAGKKNLKASITRTGNTTVLFSRSTPSDFGEDFTLFDPNGRKLIEEHHL